MWSQWLRGLTCGLVFKSVAELETYIPTLCGETAKDGAPEPCDGLKESGSRVARMPTHRMRKRRDELGTQLVSGPPATQFGAWATRQVNKKSCRI